MMTYLGIVWGQAVETFLNNMVAVQVLDELHHLTVESIDDGLDLLGRGDKFYHLL